MREKDYDAITVRELVDRAGVARSTFYRHVRSKDDLLFDGLARRLLQLRRVPGMADPGAVGRSTGPGVRFPLPLLRHLRGHRRVFRAVFGPDASPRAARRFHRLLVQVVLGELPPTPPLPTGVADRPRERLREARAHAVAGAFTALLSWWWFEAEVGLRPEAVERVFRQAVAAPLTTGPGPRSRPWGRPGPVPRPRAPG